MIRLADMDKPCLHLIYIKCVIHDREGKWFLHFSLAYDKICSRRVGKLTLADFVLGGLSFLGWKPSGWPSWLYCQWRLPSCSLVESIVWRRDLSRVKTLDLADGWIRQRWYMCTVTWRRRYGEYFLESRCCHPCACTVVSFCLFRRDFFFFFFLSFGCVHPWCLELLRTLYCWRDRV